jgi:hypothetical protein
MRPGIWEVRHWVNLGQESIRQIWSTYFTGTDVELM